MNTRFLLLFVIVIIQSCNKKDTPRQDTPPEKGRIAKIEELLNDKDQSLVDLLNTVRGSVGRSLSSSKVIWSRKNEFGLGLFISANHVYNVHAWSSQDAQFFNLLTENTGRFQNSQIPTLDGKFELGNTLIAEFPLMHFDISPGTTNLNILPAEDFYLGIVDNQRIERGPTVQFPGLVQTATPLQMYDIHNRTKASQTWNTPVAGEKALGVGYPGDKVKYPNGAASYGKILSDAEAAAVMIKLKAAGDSEGDIPYNSNVEFFVDVQVLGGMSGGGVFNTKAQLLGIMVRGTNTENAPLIMRVSKVSYIRSLLIAFYNGLPESEKSKLRPYISGEI